MIENVYVGELGLDPPAPAHCVVAALAVSSGGPVRDRELDVGIYDGRPLSAPKKKSTAPGAEWRRKTRRAARAGPCRAALRYAQRIAATAITDSRRSQPSLPAARARPKSPSGCCLLLVEALLRLPCSLGEPMCPRWINRRKIFICMSLTLVLVLVRRTLNGPLIERVCAVVSAYGIARLPVIAHFLGGGELCAH